MTDVFEILESHEKPQGNKSKGGVKEVYPFSELQVGQMFRIPDGKSVQSMRCLAYQRGISLKRKFKVSVDGYVERIK